MKYNGNQTPLTNNGSGMEPDTSGNQTPLANNGSGMEPNTSGEPIQQVIKHH